MNNLAEYYSTDLHWKNGKPTSIKRYVLAKVISALIAFLLFSFLLFCLFNPPYQRDMITKDEKIIREIEQFEKDYHLTDPYLVRYGHWLAQMISGDIYPLSHYFK